MTQSREAATETLYDAIVEFSKTNNHGPSFRELADLTGLPLGTAHAGVKALREAGRVTQSDHIARSIRVVG